MADSKRYKILRKHDQIANHFKKALAITDELGQIFREHHPEYSAGYDNICMMTVQTIQFIEKMKSFV